MRKKIISYSLWGDKRQYCVGALANAKMAGDLFPCWICRFYCADDVPPKIIQDLRLEGAEIIRKPTSLGFMGLFWRMEVADDLDVERFIVRDCDSRPTPRDAACVKEWEDSSESAHIIRDCESHGVVMLGATWGMKTSVLRDLDLSMIELMREYWDPEKPTYEQNKFEFEKGLGYGVDQHFLSLKIWPLIREHHLAHDEHFKFTGKEKPFPIKREYLKDMSKAKEPYIGQVCNIEKEYDDYIY
jgi:hypothetical protein